MLNFPLTRNIRVCMSPHAAAAGLVHSVTYCCGLWCEKSLYRHCRYCSTAARNDFSVFVTRDIKTRYVCMYRYVNMYQFIRTVAEEHR